MGIFVRKKHSEINAEKRRELEKSLLRLDGVKLDYATTYGQYDIDAHSFPSWLKFAKSLSDPDAIRNCLYYGFQPLYDCLVQGDVNDGIRPSALKVLDNIIDTNTRFLLSYYFGDPNVEIFKNGINKMEMDVNNFGDHTYYRKKARNVDRNQIYPKDIHSFMVNFLGHAIDNKLCIPDYVVGCACGSSEVAMPLAGTLGVGLGFLRKSKRRSDYEVLVVKEQERVIRKNSLDKDVVCVEDYVCTGGSIDGVMRKVAEYNANSVSGVSVRFSNEGNIVKNLVSKENFKMFKLSGL